ncbi:AraC family transcriptional regulator [Rhizorhabdus wittichii DC-6]|nr:AraC family transcriptional regulator [Rhizorhabdus wittichii DC-6]
MQLAGELSRHSILSTTDLDHARHAVGRIFCPHRLTPGSELGEGVVRFHHAPVRALSVNWVDYGRDVVIDPVPFEKFYLLQILRSGSAEIGCNGRRFALAAGEASLLNPDDEVSMRWSGHCHKLIVRIERAALERFAEDWFGFYLPGPLNFENRPGWEMPELAVARGLVELIVQDFESGVATLSHAKAQRHFEEALFTALLMSRRHSLSGYMQAGASVVPRAVKRAEDYIAAHAGEDIGIADLVAASEVSNRTLFESFRRFRGVTPMQYLRRYRLDRVREELLDPGSDVSVTDVAMRWNFDQLGRFSSYYASVFGEKPSQTLRRGRSS